MSVESLANIQDVVQRGFALSQRLLTLDDEEVVRTLKTIYDGVSRNELHYTTLYNSLTRSSAFKITFGPIRLSKLVDIAQELEYFDLIPIFIDLPLCSSLDYPNQPFLDSLLKETPLGMRKSLAKKPDFRMIQRIAKDQDHRVIRVLLDNSRLTEADVLRIGSTRPTSPKVLEEIYKHPKWIARHRIKKVIILNPYSPLSIVLRLIAFMNLEDLHEISIRPDLDPYVLHAAKKMMAKRAVPDKNYILKLDE